MPYKGQVRNTLEVGAEAKANPYLKQHIDNFKLYWSTGFHPSVGKDIATSFPNPPEGHRHAHLDPLQYPSMEEIKASRHLSYTDSEICWNKWWMQEDAPGVDANSRDTPTSDEGLFYAVDTNRNAYIFAYSGDGSLHDFMKSPEFTALVNKVADTMENHGIEMMDWEDHHTLFDDCWFEEE